MTQIISGTSDQTTVVFLHGFLLSSEQWSGMALQRAPWRSVLIDLPYHGNHKTEALSERNLKAYAKFVKTELEVLAITQYSLVGHSMGGYIGLHLLEMDDKLEQLVLLHSNLWEDSAERKKNRDRVAQVVLRNKRMFLKEALPLLFKNKHKHQSKILELIDKASKMHPEGIIHGALSMRDRKDKTALVKNHKNRCFFIQGSDDVLIPKKEAEQVWCATGNPNYFFVIPDCGHMSPFERPRSLRRVLETIVD